MTTMMSENTDGALLKQPLIICTGVLAAPPTVTAVDLLEFRKIASAFGFLLGLLSMAADMGVYAAVGRVDGGLSFRMIVTIMGTWSIVISVTTWLIYCLVQRMIAVVSFDNKNVSRAMERCCLLWSIIGLTGGYCALDFFLLPTPKFLISVFMSAVTIGVYQLLLVCIERCERWEERAAMMEATYETKISIV